MKIIEPILINNSNFISSNVTENDHAVYNAATTYSEGQKVIVTATHKIYESLQNNNLNNYPPNNLTGATPYWLDLGATNAWKMFDGKIGSQTSNTTKIEVELEPGTISGIALFKIDGISVQVVMTDATDGIVYDEEISLFSSSYGGEPVYDWYSYFFSSFPAVDNIVKLDLPPYENATTKVIINAETGQLAKCGQLIAGKTADLGITQYGPSLGMIDYSRKQADDFGNFTIIERAFSDRASVDFIIYNNNLNFVKRKLQSVRATPVVWVLTEDKLVISSMVIYGFYRDFQIVIPYISYSACSMEIEGLT